MITRNITPVRWNTGHPAINTVVWVWWLNQQVKAVWTGTVWRTPDGYQLDDITHWRALKD